MATSTVTNRKVVKFYPGLEALPFLSESLYEKLSGDSLFPRQISPSMFDYYIATAALYRIMKLNKSNGGDISVFEDRLLRTAASLKVPFVIAEYLTGFGNFDYRQLSFKLQLIPRPYISTPVYYYDFMDQYCIDGWWGKVNEGTHFLYAMYPSLPVYYIRVLKDLQYTTNPLRTDKKWDLPTDIRPSVSNAGLPTENLLGYKPAVTLRSDQVRFLNDCGISPNQCSLRCCQHSALNTSLLAKIQRTLDNYMKLIDISTGTYDHGRMSQIPYQTVLVNTIAANKTYGQCKFVNVTPLSLTSPVSFEGGTFIYRLKREVHPSRPNNWCIYNFLNYSEVPLSWQKSANIARESEDVILMRNRRQCTPYCVGTRIYRYVQVRQPR